MKEKIINVKKDLILIGICVILGLIALFIYKVQLTQGGYVTVSVDGDVVATYSLAEDGEYRIDVDDTSYNILCIDNGTAAIIEASCPDKLCVNMGRIKNNGESIVCLPNKVVVTVVDENSEDETLDGIAK